MTLPTRFIGETRIEERSRPVSTGAMPLAVPCRLISDLFPASVTWRAVMSGASLKRAWSSGRFGMETRYWIMVLAAPEGAGDGGGVAQPGREVLTHPRDEVGLGRVGVGD